MKRQIFALMLAGLMAAVLTAGCTGQQKEQDGSSNALVSTETSSQPEESSTSEVSEPEELGHEVAESSEPNTSSEETETSGADISQGPAEPESSETASKAASEAVSEDTTGFHTVSCEMPVLNGDQPQDTQLTMSVDIPAEWDCDYSILYDTAITDPALIEATGGQMKVGEFAGKRIDLVEPGLTAEEFFAQDAFQQEEQMGEPLQVRQLELGGRSAYMCQWVSYPGGGVVDTWYPHAYYVWDGDGYLCLMLYSLEESDAETLALFDAVAATVQGE